jgi:DNA-binding transcriptional MerR regulator
MRRRDALDQGNSGCNAAFTQTPPDRRVGATSRLTSPQGRRPCSIEDDVAWDEGASTMDEMLSAGEFEALTGLSAKALRLYAERAILSPAWIDPVTAYRGYDRAQIRQGLLLDLLRRAQVPLALLAEAEAIDFAARRQAVAAERLVQDLHLDVAERVAAFDPDELVARVEPAPVLDWIGVVVDLGIPDDLDERVEAFGALALDVPAIDRALADALAELGEAPSDRVWTAVPDATRSGGGRMLVARPASSPLDQRARELVDARVHARVGRTATTTAGTLPHRLEVSFTCSAGDEPDMVGEAALGHLEVLAFEEHRRRHGLAAMRATPRRVVHGPSLVGGPAPVSVFDAHLPIERPRSAAA